MQNPRKNRGPNRWVKGGAEELPEEGPQLETPDIVEDGEGNDQGMFVSIGGLRSLGFDGTIATWMMHPEIAEIIGESL